MRRNVRFSQQHYRAILIRWSYNEPRLYANFCSQLLDIKNPVNAMKFQQNLNKRCTETIWTGGGGENINSGDIWVTSDI